MNFLSIPILRIFDEIKAKEFYLDFLAMKLDWEHRVNEDEGPLYLQVSRENWIIHLSEHYGDCSPGAKLFVYVDDLDSFHQELTAKNYPYSKPGIMDAPWGGRMTELCDPFSNRFIINERNDK